MVYPMSMATTGAAGISCPVPRGPCRTALLNNVDAMLSVSVCAPLPLPDGTSSMISSSVDFMEMTTECRQCCMLRPVSAPTSMMRRTNSMFSHTMSMNHTRQHIGARKRYKLILFSESAPRSRDSKRSTTVVLGLAQAAAAMMACLSLSSASSLRIALPGLSARYVHADQLTEALRPWAARYEEWLFGQLSD